MQEVSIKILAKIELFGKKMVINRRTIVHYTAYPGCSNRSHTFSGVPRLQISLLIDIS